MHSPCLTLQLPRVDVCNTKWFLIETWSINTCVTCMHAYLWLYKKSTCVCPCPKINTFLLLLYSLNNFPLPIIVIINADILWIIDKKPIDDLKRLFKKFRQIKENEREKITSCERPVFAMFVAIHQLDKSNSECLVKKNTFSVVQIGKILSLK